MSAERKCPVCDSTDWNVLIESSTSKIMTGDQRIGKGNLNKIICTVCGLGANRFPYTEQELETLYGEEYELNTYGREEHMFFTKEGPISRSQVFCDWISPHIPTSAENLLEIGCGEGMLLSKIQATLPELHCTGIDGSKKASNLAKKKGLNVSQRLIHHSNDDLPKSDVIMMINVIEHVEDLKGVIQSMKNALRDDGRIIFCLPIQDYGGYDIVFAEHVWHFTVKQFKRILQRNGLNIVHTDANHPINHGIGLFVCESGNPQIENVGNQTSVLKDSWSKWNNVFNHVNTELVRLGPKSKLAVFGSGEVLTLLLAFSNLSNRSIEFVIDETPSKIGTLKHGVKIFGLDKLKDSVPEAVLVTTNPKYNQIITEKLRKSFDSQIILLP